MRLIVLFIMLAISTLGMAQDPADVPMADQFRADGKIYVVVAVILIILIGLFAYLIRIDRKISRLEKDKNSED